MLRANPRGIETPRRQKRRAMNWPTRRRAGGSGFIVCLCFSVSLCLCGSSPARAELDPGLQKPYELHVVLHVAEHRALTPTFQEQVQRQLRDHLRLALGKLANVTILRTHPRLAEVRSRGLQQALDGWTDLSGVKTHFVLIDYRDGRYELQARQHDGISGLASPVVRRDATSDRRLVARKAALLVDYDFGLVGTVARGADGKAQLAIWGGDLGVPLGRWLRDGDVFTVARITREGDRQRATRLDWALLQVRGEPSHGICRCRFVTRFQENQLTEGGSVLGYRCLKLTTTTAPLRLRLLEDGAQGAVPLSGMQVRVGSSDFDAPDALKLASGPEGLAVTPEPVAQVAFVQVFSGPKERARFPVAIVDDRTLVCRLRANPEADAQGQLELRRDRWVRRIYDLLLADANRVQYLNDRLKAAREEALTVAQAGVKGLGEEITSLKEEGAQLREAADKLGKGPLDLTEGEQRLAELDKRRKTLEHFQASLENALKQETSEQAKTLRTLLEQARLLESQAEFEQALALYRKVLRESPDQPKVKAYLDKLEQAWKVTSREHQQARDFIYHEWSNKLDTAGLKAALPKAREALAVCLKAGDRLTPQKLLQADLAHVAALKQRLDVLRQRESEDNRNEARTIGQLSEELGRLHHDAAAAVGKKDAPGS
jgi:hypothetical protein